MQSIDWFYTREGELSCGEVYTNCPDPFAGDKICLGEEFVGRDRYLWLEREIHVPEEKDGCKVMGYFNFGKTGGGGNSGFEALLYINGQPCQGVDTNHREVVLTPFAGQTIRMTFLLWSGLEGGGPIRPQYHRIAEAGIGYLDEKLDALYYQVSAVAGSLAYLASDSLERTELVSVLDRTLSYLDWDADRLPETGAQALDFLQAALDDMPKNSGVTVYATGHTHIDVSWLWRLKHTREKAQRSFSTVLRLMEEYPEYHFLQTQPQLYKFLKKDSPVLYEGIKQRVKEGRWEADGGMWLEADCNVTSGESLARQFLYGIRFIEEEFGTKSHFLWLPDVFGYSWALPQIMKLCGLDTFMTTKISWNQYNTVPNDLFRWRGIDGTEMLTYFVDVPAPGMSVTGRGSTYNGEITPETIIGTWRKFKNKDLSHEVLISYGHGDGGGGTTRSMIENIRAINRVPGMPHIKTANAQEFFEKSIKMWNRRIVMCLFGTENCIWNITAGPIPPRPATSAITGSWKMPWASWNGFPCFPALPAGHTGPSGCMTAGKPFCGISSTTSFPVPPSMRCMRIPPGNTKRCGAKWEICRTKPLGYYVIRPKTAGA